MTAGMTAAAQRTTRLRLPSVQKVTTTGRASVGASNDIWRASRTSSNPSGSAPYPCGVVGLGRASQRIPWRMVDTCGHKLSRVISGTLRACREAKGSIVVSGNSILEYTAFEATVQGLGNLIMLHNPHLPHIYYIHSHSKSTKHSFHSAPVL